MSLSLLVIEDLTCWIEKNLRRPLTINDIALHAGYSKWHLQRIFYQYKGERLASYVRRRKMELAACDLCCTHERIVDISEKYGFDSQQSFTRLFTRTFNIPPMAYRKRKSML